MDWPKSSACFFLSQYPHSISMVTSVSPFSSFLKLHPALPAQQVSALAGSSLVTVGQSQIADGRGDSVNYSRAHHGFLAHLIWNYLAGDVYREFVTCHSSRKTLQGARLGRSVSLKTSSSQRLWVLFLCYFSIPWTEAEWIKFLLRGCGKRKLQYEEDSISENAGNAFENTVFH